MLFRSKVISARITGSMRIYNASSRLLAAEGAAMKSGKDLRHTFISKLDDPDAVSAQRVMLTGVSFDDLTLADWEAAKLGTIEAPFTADGYEILEYYREAPPGAGPGGAGGTLIIKKLVPVVWESNMLKLNISTILLKQCGD